MKTTKINAMALVALVIAGLTGLTLTSAGASNKITTPWIEVTSNASSPDDDQLGNEISDPTFGGLCNTAVKPIRCAVKFNNPDNHDLSNMTVDQALQQSGVTISSRTYKP